MKVINEKGKLFGIINPIDLLILLAIIVVVSAVGIKFLKAPVEAAVSNKQDMYVTLRIRGALPSLVDAAEQIKQGTALVAGNDYVSGATVDSVTTEPYEYTVTTDQGVCVETVDPVKRDIVVVIKSTGSPSDAILKIGNQEVRTGRGFIFKTNMVEVNATIESVRFDG